MHKPRRNRELIVYDDRLSENPQTFWQAKERGRTQRRFPGEEEEETVWCWESDGSSFQYCTRPADAPHGTACWDSSQTGRTITEHTSKKKIDWNVQDTWLHITLDKVKVRSFMIRQYFWKWESKQNGFVVRSNRCFILEWKNNFCFNFCSEIDRNTDRRQLTNDFKKTIRGWRLTTDGRQ